ncbi:Glycosyltransferase [Quillaja saponaria]|uniref:Glycosyltransferase n=1 Tax=Quillaja saponaria TaxID=32244 RepID=A0AAD7PPV4_QUISA|nr:Glycosyltransferase [Quillaja saponaria]
MSLGFLRRRPTHDPDPFPLAISPLSSLISQRPVSNFSLFILLFLILELGVFLVWVDKPESLSSSNKPAITKWHDYTLIQAVSFVAKNGTVIVCAVSQPYLPFLNNWLISITRQKHQNKVLVIAEDYGTLDKVNGRWPGHAVLIPPALDAQTTHKFGSKDFINFAARRPRHLLQILELGYNVMYNDVDMVWLADPFPYLLGIHDIYFTDDMAAVKPLNHSHDFPSRGKNGQTYELQIQPWSNSKGNKSNYDQSAFNWALKKTAREADLYLLPQAAFPPGRLFFKNKTWVKETKGKHVIIHNDYITSSEKKIKRFRQFGLWLVDDHSIESPLGKL